MSEAFAFAPQQMPVISNVTARPHVDADIRARMIEQIAAPVRWSESLRYLMAKGVAFADTVEIGPDGAVYVADWYNSIINHAQHDFRDPRRDHEHGRIWRITHKDRPLVPKPELVGRSINYLVEQLGSPQTWTRHQARKELSERDPDAVLAAADSSASPHLDEVADLIRMV